MKEATIKLKIDQVEIVHEKMVSSGSSVFVDYLGLTVAEMTELRRNLYNADCEIKVVKNNILKRAAHKAGFEGLDDSLKGPSAVAFSKDGNTASKIIYDFIKKCDRLEVKAGVVEGKVIDNKELKIIANLPNKEGMISMFLSVLQAPIRNFACAIKAVAEKN
ncbi:MAG: 50S ribosomal protein L10 [Bacilli bacterium]|nr:50S ribosomal protein L10 [Bacilli bacterium]